MRSIQNRLASLETALALVGEEKPLAAPLAGNPVERAREIIAQAKARLARGEPRPPETPESRAASERLRQAIELAKARLAGQTAPVGVKAE